MIVRIQVKSKYSLVDIDKNSSAMVLERMKLCKIGGFEVNVKEMNVLKRKIVKTFSFT